MKKHFLLFAAFIGITLSIGLFSCNSNTPANSKNNYFNLKDFLQKEIQNQQNQGFKLQKSIILDQKKEDKILSEIKLADELSLFINADLNKPAFANSYDNLSENGILWYSLKTDENLPVKKMVIHLDAFEHPENIEIVIQEKNILFQTEKKLNMNLHEGHIQTYSIEGKQQLAWLEPTTYKILGVILSK